MKKFLKIAFLVLCAVLAITALSACAPAENRVSYYDGTRQISTSSVKRGMAATDFTAPSKPGYTFAGWYLDPEFTTPYSGATRVYNNTKLYAKYIPVTTGTKTGTAAGTGSGYTGMSGNTQSNITGNTIGNTVGNTMGNNMGTTGMNNATGNNMGTTGMNGYTGTGYNGMNNYTGTGNNGINNHTGTGYSTYPNNGMNSGTMRYNNDGTIRYNNNGTTTGGMNRGTTGTNGVNYYNNGTTGTNGLNYYNGVNGTTRTYPNTMTPPVSPISPATSGAAGSTTNINPTGINNTTNSTRGSSAGTSANTALNDKAIADTATTYQKPMSRTYPATTTPPATQTRLTAQTVAQKAEAMNKRMQSGIFCGLGGGYGTGNGMDTNLNGTSLNGSADASTMYDARNKATVNSQRSTSGTTQGTDSNAVKSIRFAPQTTTNQTARRTRTGVNRQPSNSTTGQNSTAYMLPGKYPSTIR